MRCEGGEGGNKRKTSNCGFKKENNGPPVVLTRPPSPPAIAPDRLYLPLSSPLPSPVGQGAYEVRAHRRAPASGHGLRLGTTCDRDAGRGGLHRRAFLRVSPGVVGGEGEGTFLWEEGVRPSCLSSSEPRRGRGYGCGCWAAGHRHIKPIHTLSSQLRSSDLPLLRSSPTPFPPPRSAAQTFPTSLPPPLRSAAQTFLASCSSPVEALAKALAKITGITAMRPRSLINADEGVTTLLFTCEHEVTSPSAIWGYLRSERVAGEGEGGHFFTSRPTPPHTLDLSSSVSLVPFCSMWPASLSHAAPTHAAPTTFIYLSPPFRKACRVDEDTMNLVNRMTLTADGKGAIFDVPSEHVHKFIKGAGAYGGTSGGVEHRSKDQLLIY